MLEQFHVYGEKIGIMESRMMNRRRKRHMANRYWKDTFIREVINSAVTKVHAIAFRNMWRNKWYSGKSHNIKH